MSESFITQCPHCQTRFRVSQTQLGAANGAVRCGTCLKVFNAPQYIQGERPATPPAAPTPAPSVVPTEPKVAVAPETPAAAAPQERPAAPGTATLGWPLAPHAARPSGDIGTPATPRAPTSTPTPTPTAPTPKPAAEPAPAKAKDETLWIHDDLDLDSLNLDEELAKLDEFELSQEFLSIDRAPAPSEALLAHQDEKRDPHDERWAEALLQEEQNSANRTSRQEPSLGPLPADEPDEVTSSPQAHTQAADEEPPATPANTISASDDDDERLPAFSARRDDEIEDTDDHDEPEPDANYRAEPALRDDSLRELSDEPLQLDWQKPKSRWGRRVLWLLLILLGLAGLAGQYIAYHFEELARQDQYRPWFAQACPELGCTLPSKVDVEQIRSSNLVVRSHPDFSGALVVDAIIYNRANFSQPFPLLEMRFADLNGQLIASRRFKPSEYLSGELAGQSEMPPQTPIHISLDILDPGPKAVNYSLSFHSPE